MSCERCGYTSIASPRRCLRCGYDRSTNWPLVVLTLLLAGGFGLYQCGKAIDCYASGGTPAKGWFGQAVCVRAIHGDD